MLTLEVKTVYRDRITACLLSDQLTYDNMADVMYVSLAGRAIYLCIDSVRLSLHLKG